MLEFMLYFGAALIFYWIVDAINSTDCKVSFDELCEKSNTITLTWGTFQGHGTNENGERAVISNFPTAIGIASKYGFKAETSNQEMVVLHKAS